MLVLNLDTNHVSNLVREPEDVHVRDVLRILLQGDVHLGFSHFHVVQLAHPAFKHWDDLKALLRDVRTVLLQPREDVFADECASAVARVCRVDGGFTRRPPRVFARDTSEWGDYPGPVGGGPIDFIDYYRAHPDEAITFHAMGERYAELARMKGAAFVVQHPLAPLEAEVDEHVATIRARNPGYAAGWTPPAIVAAAGGLPAFPAFQVSHELTMYSLLHEPVVARAGDLADEYIASYAPYVSVTALDRATAHRIREARLASAPRITASLAAVPRVLDDVVAGRLTPVVSAALPARR